MQAVAYATCGHTPVLLPNHAAHHTRAPPFFVDHIHCTPQLAQCQGTLTYDILCLLAGSWPTLIKRDAALLKVVDDIVYM